MSNANQTTYPCHEHVITHFGTLLRYTHNNPDAHYLMAKGERFDETAMQWVAHPIGIGYYAERSWPYSRETAARLVAEHIAELSQPTTGA